MKILIVDDDPSIRVMLKLVFEIEGFEVVQAPHGAAALDLLKDPLPSLVVTDMMMPVMDGKDLIRHLRSNPVLAALPIVVVSGNPDALEAGRMADAVIGKPFGLDELRETVERIGSAR